MPDMVACFLHILTLTYIAGCSARLHESALYVAGQGQCEFRTQLTLLYGCSHRFCRAEAGCVTVACQIFMLGLSELMSFTAISAGCMKP